MRKVVLSMLFVVVSVLVSAAQDMISFHVEVDDASHVLASETYYDSSLGYAVENALSLKDGDNIISLSNYHTLTLRAADSYFITGCVQKSSGANNYVSGKTTTQIYANPSIEGDTYTVTTKAIADCRTASVTVNIDHPEKVNAQRWQLDGYILFEEPSTVLNYDPTDELPITIGTKNYSDKIYKVTVSEGTVEEAYGRYRVTPADGAAIDVTVDFPDIDVTYTLVSTTGDFDFLRVRAGSPLQDVDISEGSFTVKAGTSVEYSFDTQNYKIESFLINDVPNNNLYYYSFTATEDATHTFTARPYKEYVVRVHLSHADKARVLKGGFYGTQISADEDGVFNVPMKEPYDYQLSVLPVTDWYISDVRIAPEVESIIFNKSSFSYNAPEECDVYVDLAEIMYDHKTALYIDNVDALSSWSAYNEMDYSNVFSNPCSGYTVYDVSLAKSPVRVNAYLVGGSPVTQIYHNHELLKPENEWSTTVIVHYTGNDVIHIFCEDEPENATVTFDIEEGLSVAALHNKVVPVEDFNTSLTLFKGDELVINVAYPNDTYVMTVGGERVEPDQNGNFTIDSLAGDTDIKVTRVSGIIGASIEDAIQQPVYNLQGMEVDRDHLTPGIYISAGRKFTVK